MELVLVAVYIMILLFLLVIIGVIFMVLCEIGKHAGDIRRDRDEGNNKNGRARDE